MEIRALLVTTKEEQNKVLREGGHCGQAMATVCITDNPQLVERLAQADLPCIYLEDTQEEGKFVSGADLVLQAKTDRRAGAEGNYGLEPELLLRVWQRHYHLPWTIAQSGRLLIRESVMEDLKALLAMYGEEADNPDVALFSQQPQEELQAYIQQRYPLYGYGLWSVLEKETARVVGRAGLEDGSMGMELAYMIAKEFRGMGYAREAAQSILSYAREELGQKEIWLRTSRQNKASQKLAQELGFEEWQTDGETKIFQLFLEKNKKRY